MTKDDAMNDNSLRCDEVLDLVPAFVDDEAGPSTPALRQHLIECASCRSAVQELRALKGWFVPTAEVDVPVGFAERVARLAYRDSGASDVPDSIVRPVSNTPGPRLVQNERRRLADFAIALTAVAAAALILVTLLIASDGRGDVDPNASMQADTRLEEQLGELERLNAAEEDLGK